MNVRNGRQVHGVNVQENVVLLCVIDAYGVHTMGKKSRIVIAQISIINHYRLKRVI